MSRWSLNFYVSGQGRAPVRDFLDRLSDDEMIRVDHKLRMLAEFGTDLDYPHVARVRGDIWELRVTGRIHHRVFYVTIERRQILLLHAFTKKTRKTPQNELTTAERRLADYRRRMGKS